MFSKRRSRRPCRSSLRAATQVLAEARNARLAAIYTALASVHSATAESKSITDLFSRACTALTRQGAFCGAWAGRFHDNGALQVLVASGKLDDPPPSFLSPSAKEQAWVEAISTKKAVFIHPDDALAHRDPVLVRFGCPWAVYLPMGTESPVSSILCVASKHDVFARDEIAMLIELSRSLSANVDRLVAERSLAAQRELLRAVFDCATYGIYYVADDGIVQLCNNSFLRLVGKQRDNTIGQSYQVVTPPEYIEEERATVDAVISSGLPSEYDKQIVREDGFRIPVRLSIAPVRGRTGKPTGIVAVMRDTVAEREAAKALSESRERYHAVFHNNPDAIFVVDTKGRVLDVNPAASTLTGMSRQELLNSDITHLVAQGDVDAFEKALDSLQQEGSVHRPLMRFRGIEGRIVPTELYGTPLASQLWQVLARNIEARLEAQEKLRSLNDILEEKVAARTKQLEEAYVKLERAGKVKEEFVANMSHELRTPLNSVLGLADALLDGVFGEVEEQQAQILETMRGSGKHLLELINDILDLSKIEAGKLDLDLRPISVNEVCQVSLRMIRPIAYRKRIGFWMRTDSHCPVVVADERRLKQMLVNLLSNAVKFTPAGGKVGLEAWAKDQEVYFSVNDTGIGISPPDLRRVFEPFTQIDSSLSRQHEGTGLGLALVQKLALLHGGRVDVASRPGEGSRFTIVLPRRTLPEQERDEEDGFESDTP